MKLFSRVHHALLLSLSVVLVAGCVDLKKEDDQSSAASSVFSSLVPSSSSTSSASSLSSASSNTSSSASATASVSSWSSAIATVSVSSSSFSEGVEVTFPGDAVLGEDQFAANCNGCHVDQFDGSFSKGLHAFDVNQFTYPDYAQYSAYSDSSVEELARFIDEQMAGSSCDESCANNIAAYLWSYLEAQKAVTVQLAVLDEQGLHLSLQCDVATDLRLDVSAADLADAGSSTLVHSQALACLPVAQTFVLEGFSDLDLLQVSFYQGETSLDSIDISRSFDANTSCTDRGELLDPKLRRLSQIQLRNSLTDIFGDIFDEQVWPDLEDGARLIGMNTMADKLAINNLNLERLYDSSRTLVTTLLTDHTTIGACADSTSTACVQTLIESFGQRLWRRPLTATEQADFAQAAAVFDNNRDALEFVFNALILSSEFLFRSEIGALEQGLNRLGNYEIVSLLAFSIWNSTPDDTLLNLAAQEQPLDVSQLQAQVTRMIEDPRMSLALIELYKDYLKLDLIMTRDKADYFLFDQDVRAQLLVSSEQMLAAQISPSRDYMAPFGSSPWYVNNTTAAFFNVNSSSEDLTVTSIPEAQRFGILNHPAFLSVHSTLAESGIVKRGVFALEQLLCEELPDPPGDVMTLPAPEGLDPEATSERVLLQLTHSSQPTCNACHQFIDPAGFGFENFDAVGRYRTEEKGVVPIDASGSLQVGAETLIYNSSAEYAQVLVGSDAMAKCVSRRFLEHYLSHELSANHCELNRYRSLFASEPTVTQMLMALVQLESFSRRNAE